MSADPSYTRIYNVGLFDDLHNYLPDILYAPERFASIGDLLFYVQTTARTRFNLFDRGAAAAMNDAAPSGVAVPTPVPGYRTPSRTRLPQVIPPPVRPRTRAELAATIPIITYTPLVTPVLPLPPARAPQSQSLLNLIANINSLETVVNESTDIYNATNDVIRQITETSGRIYELSEESATNSVATRNMIDSTLDIIRGINLLTQFTGGGAGGYEPVPVQPTSADLETNTRILTISDVTNTHECAICLATMDNGDICRKLLGCRHMFHKDCIDRHFEMSPRCPMCRADVRDPIPAATPSA